MKRKLIVDGKADIQATPLAFFAQKRRPRCSSCMPPHPRISMEELNDLITRKAAEIRHLQGLPEQGEKETRGDV